MKILHQRSDFINWVFINRKIKLLSGPTKLHDELWVGKWRESYLR